MAVEELGYTEPSEIQDKAIPLIMAGHDVLGIAQTGTGKTAAFSLPMLQLLDNNVYKTSLHPDKYKRPPIRSLILTPTRELAIQIGESIADYGKYTTLKHAVIYGGVGQAPQVKKLQQ
jgi:ATP-dependent RNA helicase RhlE